MNTNQDKHLHADGWTSDETFRGMRRACEQYKKKDKENIQLKKDLEKLKQENIQLKQENEKLKQNIQLKQENEKLVNQPDWRLLLTPENRKIFKHPDPENYWNLWYAQVENAPELIMSLYNCEPGAAAAIKRSSWSWYRSFDD